MDRRPLVLLVSLVLGISGNSYSAPPPTTAGAPDTSFGSGGLRVIDYGGGNDTAPLVAVQPDGKIIVVGSSDTWIIPMRLNSDGSDDFSLIGGGMSWGNYGFIESGAFVTSTPRGVTLQSDGGIVICASADSETTSKFGLMRFTGNDPAPNLQVIHDMTGGTDTPRGCLVQPDGKIVIAGDCNSDFCVLRLNGTDGSPDLSFSDDGKAFADFRGLSEGASGVVLLNSRIYVVGYARFNHSGRTDDDLAIACFESSSGAPCGGFPTDGRATNDLGANDRILAVVADSSGYLVLAGYHGTTSTIRRFNLMTVSFDPDFGGDLTSTSPNQANAIAIAADGKFLVAGSDTCAGSDGCYYLARFGTSGAIDTSFWAGGAVIKSIGSLRERGTGVAIQPDQKIVVVGDTMTSGGASSDFFVARFKTNDLDNDGRLDSQDNCQDSPNFDQSNIDGDSQGDVCDPDDDNDEICSRWEEVVQNVCSLSPTGSGQNGQDNCPFQANRDQLDRNMDGEGDVCDTDDDGDGVSDTFPDNCPLNPNDGQQNTDRDLPNGDLLGDACDPDDDGDGIEDLPDNCPLTPNAGQEDADRDGTGDPCDNDLDGDNAEVVVGTDNCPRVPNVDQLDTEGDGEGDACDNDDDNDDVPDLTDNCRLVANRDRQNTDGDMNGDACDDDYDNDGVADLSDNCSLAPNADQRNNDNLQDGGDPCDLDDDEDTVPDLRDNCPFATNREQEDIDSDGTGDLCDGDRDSDTRPDEEDNCLAVPNPAQEDADKDRAGDACDPDDDNDDVADMTDNCPLVVNPLQADGDTDGTGSACDPDEKETATPRVGTTGSGISQSDAKPAGPDDSKPTGAEAEAERGAERGAEGEGAPRAVPSPAPPTRAVGTSACTLIREPHP